MASSSWLVHWLKQHCTHVVVLEIASDSDTPHDVLAHLGNWSERDIAAAATSTLRRTDEQTSFAKHDCERMPRKGALHDYLIDFLEECVKMGNFETREEMAATALLPYDVFQRLATDRRSTVREAAASNPYCPEDLLAELVFDKQQSVAREAVHNKRIQREILDAYDRNLDKSLLEYYASSPRTLPGTLTRLAASDDLAVRLAAISNPGLPMAEVRKRLFSSEKLERRAAASNPSLDSDLIMQISASPDRDLRAGVAANTSTLPDALKSLAVDSDEGVRVEVAKNPRTPRDTLEAMRTTGSDQIAIALASNPDLPLKVARLLAMDQRVNVRRRLAQAHTQHAEIADLLVADKSPDVRLALARSRWTPTAALEKLVLDYRDDVAGEAVETLRERDHLAGVTDSRWDYLAFASLDPEEVASDTEEWDSLPDEIAFLISHELDEMRTEFDLESEDQPERQSD